MGRIILGAAVVTACVLFAGAPASWADSGFLYGTIITDNGDELTGRIRWDKNEGSWDDYLDCNKNHQGRRTSSRSNRSRVSIFGIEVYSEGDGWGSNTTQSGLRFGYIDKIVPRSGSKASIVLKGEQKYAFSGGSDLGSGIRELLIDDANEGVIELDWDDIDEIRFHPEDGSYKPSREFAGSRLYGVVETEPGLEFEGFIQWDVDEIWTTDILDGDQSSKSRKIPFDRIAKIEKLSSRASRITLSNGSTMKLSGSNDVNDENRGIIIMVPDWGRVTVNWDEFQAVTFKPAPENAVRAYDNFAAPWRLRGTVHTEYGDTYTGEISWDADEEFSWEVLDGEYRDMEFDIELGYIKTIQKRNSSSSDVELFSGDQFRLRGSNDVDDSNSGIIVTTDNGDEVEVDWEEFEKIEFEKGR